ncbi:tyrosine-protein phosphatase siw14 [Collariella sp. IMI 366227]|nr:tyrosine-protein phosphatase siw14 [Collariella sp. IMI 366227]
MPDKMGQKVVSKRSSKPYVNYDMEKEVDNAQTVRVVQQEEKVSEDCDNRSLTSTGTVYSYRSSREHSPIASSPPEYLKDPARGLDAEKRHHTDVEIRDVFYPPLTAEDLVYSPRELEKGLLCEGRPANFGIVVPGVYRSSFPQSDDYAFIKELKLKTIVTLVQKDFPQGYEAFLKKNGIRHVVFDMKGTKKEDIPLTTMKSILRVVLDRRNHPMLVHCNHGKHRTGCVIGVIRKMSGWNLDNTIGEYKAYANPKARDCDINYLTGFEVAHTENLFLDPPAPFQAANSNRSNKLAVFFVFVFFYVCNKVTNSRLPSSS